jgi:hypothetical protein
MVNMNTNVRRIATQPVVRAVVPTSEKTIMSKLTKSPSDLFALWREYEQGLDGGKAAKDYTAVERGRNKHTYSRRRVFWDSVVKLVARGYMADSAIDRISGAYGRRLSVTQVINQMKKIGCWESRGGCDGPIMVAAKGENRGGGAYLEYRSINQ